MGNEKEKDEKELIWRRKMEAAGIAETARPLAVRLDHGTGEPCSDRSGTGTGEPVSIGPVHPVLYATNPDALPCGVKYFPDFLTREEEQKLIRIIDSHRWSNVFRRRQQFYGEVYYHTTRPTAAVQPVQPVLDSVGTLKNMPPPQIAIAVDGLSILKDDPNAPIDAYDISELDWLIDKFYGVQDGVSTSTSGYGGKAHGSSTTANSSSSSCTVCSDSVEAAPVGSTGLFSTLFGPCGNRAEFPTQILVNEYRENVGIATHFEDVDAFGDVIVTISLLNPIYMTLEQPLVKDNDCREMLRDSKVLLEPRSMMVMSSDARFEYRHGISRHLDVWTPENGGMIVKRKGDYRRVSFTIRHLLKGRRQVGKEKPNDAVEATSVEATTTERG